MKQLGISFSSNFDDNTRRNVGIRILSRVAYPEAPGIPINRKQNREKESRVDFEAVWRSVNFADHPRRFEQARQKKTRGQKEAEEKRGNERERENVCVCVCVCMRKRNEREKLG